MLNIIKKIHQLLFKEKDRTKLLQGICENLTGGQDYYDSVWIAVLDKSGGLAFAVEAGLGQRFLPVIEQLKRGKLPDCVRKVTKQSGIVLTKDPFSTCKDCPLSKQYNGSGVMTVCLKYRGRIYGTLSASISKRSKSDEEMHGLLEEIAGDIAFTLHNMELEKERKRIKEALQESEKRFRALVENSLTGILIIQDGQVVYMNPEQERLFRPFPKSFNLADFKNIHQDDVEKVRKSYKALISGEVQALQMEFRFYPLGETDSMKWVYCRANKIEYGGHEAILLNMMDITRAKELEHLLRMEDKMTSLGRVATGIAHEIRNPLSGINIYLNTLDKIYDKGGSFEKAKKIISQMQSASSRIESVITRVMDFAKSSEPKFVFTDVNQPIEEAISLSSVVMRKSGIKIEKALAEDLPLCYMDPSLITEVLLNLITNASEAMKNMEGAKKIEIASSAENNCIIISVSDSGPGIPSNLRDKLFDPFYTTKQGNSGIGLSLCNRIIMDHGGSLNISTSKWGGALFIIEIPLEKEKRRDDFLRHIHR